MRYAYLLLNNGLVKKWEYMGNKPNVKKEKTKKPNADNGNYDDDDENII